MRHKHKKNGSVRFSYTHAYVAGVLTCFSGTSASAYVLVKTRLKGLAKLGNIVTETFLQKQMFPSLATQETYVAEINFAARKQENVFALSQKHICFSDTNFASETYVSQFGHPIKHDPQQCFRNNVS